MKAWVPTFPVLPVQVRKPSSFAFMESLWLYHVAFNCLFIALSLWFSYILFGEFQQSVAKLLFPQYSSHSTSISSCSLFFLGIILVHLREVLIAGSDLSAPAPSRDGVLIASGVVSDPAPNHHFIACFLGPLLAPVFTD